MNIRYLEEFSFGANDAKEIMQVMLRQYQTSLLDRLESVENERAEPTRTADRIRGEIHAIAKAIEAVAEIDTDPCNMTHSAGRKTNE